MTPERLEAAIEEQKKLAKLRDAMARDCFLDVNDLARRWKRSVKTIYRLPVPRTTIMGSPAVLFHPEDVLACEERDRIVPRITPEMLADLEASDDPRVRPVYEVLAELVS